MGENAIGPRLRSMGWLVTWAVAEAVVAMEGPARSVSG
jgi:hypothetical protein